MEYKKLGLSLALSATFGLLACGGDSSSGSLTSSPEGDGEFTISCKVQDDPFKIIQKIDGYTVETSLSYEDGKIITKNFAKFTTQKEADIACKEAKDDANDGDEEEDITVKCDGKTVTETYSENGDKNLLKSMKEGIAATCEKMNNQKTSSNTKNSSDSSKNGKSSSSTSNNTNKTSKDGFTLIENEGLYYRGHGCDFKMSDKTWKYEYEENWGFAIAEVKVVCEDLNDDKYSYDKICTETVTASDKDFKDDCKNASTENYKRTCKGETSIEEFYTRNFTEDLFQQTMRFCQKINLNPDWEYKPESSTSKNKSSSSKKSDNDEIDNGDNDNGDNESSDSGDNESSDSNNSDNEDNNNGLNIDPSAFNNADLEQCKGKKNGTKIDIGGIPFTCQNGELVPDEDGLSDLLGTKTQGCDKIDLNDDVWIFYSKPMGIPLTTKITWTSKTSYKEISYILDYETLDGPEDLDDYEMLASEEETAENVEREDIYNSYCGE